MNRVLVSIERDGSEPVDIDVADNLPVAHIAAAVSDALGWSTSALGTKLVFDVEIHPPGRTLLPHEVLADAFAHDGARLVLKPRAGVSAHVRSERPVPSASSRPGAGRETAPVRHAWKRLEEDGGGADE